MDCGCGPIGALTVMADIVGPTGRVVGVDVSKPAIQRAVHSQDVPTGQRGADRGRHLRPGADDNRVRLRPGFHALFPNAPGRPCARPRPDLNASSSRRLGRNPRATVKPTPAVIPTPRRARNLLGSPA